MCITLHEKSWNTHTHFFFFSPFLKARQIILMERYNDPCVLFSFRQRQGGTEVPKEASCLDCQCLQPDRLPYSLPINLQITPAIENNFCRNSTGGVIYKVKPHFFHGRGPSHFSGTQGFCANSLRSASCWEQAVLSPALPAAAMLQQGLPLVYSEHSCCVTLALQYGSSFRAVIFSELERGNSRRPSRQR